MGVDLKVILHLKHSCITTLMHLYLHRQWIRPRWLSWSPFKIVPCPWAAVRNHFQSSASWVLHIIRPVFQYYCIFKQLSNLDFFFWCFKVSLLVKICQCFFALKLRLLPEAKKGKKIYTIPHFSKNHFVVILSYRNYSFMNN